MRVARVNLIRHALSMLIALLVAFIINFYFSISHEYLIPLAAIIVMLTSVGNLIYQGLKRFLLLIVITIILSVIFASTSHLYARIGDICIGAVIGIVINLGVLPRRSDIEFRAALLPLLKAYSIYVVSIVDLLVQKNKKEIEAQKINIEFQLQELPTWVYAKGFDSGLKKGHQYFLMKTYQVSEILFSMHNIARNNFDNNIIKKVREPLQECAQCAHKFFNALQTVFELKRLTHGVDDFDSELAKLERKFNSLIPPNMELLDLPNQLVNFYEFIYALKDLRNALIKLGQALR
jgi:hypothetical protein